MKEARNGANVCIYEMPKRGGAVSEERRDAFRGRITLHAAREAVHGVVDRLWDVELSAYLTAAIECRVNHPFLDLVIMRRWLDNESRLQAAALSAAAEMTPSGGGSSVDAVAFFAFEACLGRGLGVGPAACPLCGVADSHVSFEGADWGVCFIHGLRWDAGVGNAFACRPQVHLDIGWFAEVKVGHPLEGAFY